MAEMNFRDLTVDNLFDFCSVLDAVGAEQVIGAFDKNEIAALQKSGNDIAGIGVVIAMKIAGVIIKSLPQARDTIYTFIAGCTVWDNGTDVTPEDVRKLKIGAFATLLRDFFKKDDLTDFFGQVAEYLGMGQSDSENCVTGDTVIRPVF